MSCIALPLRAIGIPYQADSGVFSRIARNGPSNSLGSMIWCRSKTVLPALSVRATHLSLIAGSRIGRHSLNAAWSAIVNSPPSKPAALARSLRSLIICFQTAASSSFAAANGTARIVRAIFTCSMAASISATLEPDSAIRCPTNRFPAASVSSAVRYPRCNI